MLSFRLGLGAALVALATSAVAPAKAESLADALVLALRASPELRLNRANVKVLSERAVQARGRGRVQVSANIDLTTQFANLSEWRFPTTLGLNVTQPLYTGGQVENRTEAAEIRISAEEARLIATEQLILLRAVTAYLDVRRDQTLIGLSQNNVRVINEQLRAARERFDVGEVTRTDVSQAEARLAAARSTVAARTGQLQASREAYKRIVGKYPGKLEPPPPAPDLPATLDQAIAIAVRDQPEIVAARLERLASTSDVRAAIGGLLPQVSLLGQVRNSDDLNVRFDGRTDAAIGLQIQIPIYDGGVTYSQVREAQASVELREGQITLALRDTIENVGVAWSDLDVSAAVIRSGQLQVRAAQIAFEGVSEEARVGARTTLDVLDAEQELLNARGDLVTARRNRYVAAYNVLFSIGKLTANHLGLAVDPEEPVDQYYEQVRDRNFGYDRTDDTVWSLTYRP